MPAAVTELAVFLASPSDLTEEREVVQAVVERANALWAQRGLRFRVVRYENVLPDMGRAQALINPALDDADIVIGILGRRWGNPTGTHDSGFAEEFELAQTRWKASGKPSIHLYFKTISSDDLADPGASMQKVLEFKKRIRAEFVAMYSTFSGSSDLALQIQELLTKKAIEHLGSRAAEELALGAEDSEPDIAVGVSTEPKDEARLQLAAALEAVLGVVHGEPYPDGGLDVDRVELMGRAFGTDKDVLGAHLTNRLFHRHSELVLSQAEGELWIRTLLSDIGRSDPAHRVIPGWGVFVDASGSYLHDELGELAASDDADVARGAIRAIIENDLRPATLSLDPAAVGAGVDAKEVARLWLGVLNANSGLSEAFDLFLATFGTEHVIAQRVGDAAELNEGSAVLLRMAKDAAEGRPDALASDFAIASGRDGRNQTLRGILLAHLGDVSDDVLKRLGLRVRGDDLRWPVLEALLRRRLLTSDELERMVDWDSPETMASLTTLALSDGEIATQIAEVDKTKAKPVRAAVRTLVHSLEELREEYIQSPWADEAWEAALLSGDAIEDAAARDLIDSKAEGLRKDLATHLVDREDVVHFVAGLRIGSAGIHLAKFLADDQSDAAARDADLRRIVESVNMVHRSQRRQLLWALTAAVDAASAADIQIVSPLLEDVVNSLPRSEWEDLLDTPLGSALARAATSSEDPAVRNVARAWLAGQPSTSEDQLLADIYDEDIAVRFSAVNGLIARWTDDQLAQLLNDYGAGRRLHWYNVVCRLDTHLYARESPYGSEEVKTDGSQADPA